MSESNGLVLQSQLKQQCLNDDGLYSWQKKFFTLHVAQGVLEITTIVDDNLTKGGQTAMHNIDTTTSSIHATLQGARYAKEWSFSSALAGYGFDILWTSGKIWSFLVEDEKMCHEWVEKLNISIQNVNTISNTSSGITTASISSNSPNVQSIPMNIAQPTLQQLANLPVQSSNIHMSTVAINSPNLSMCSNPNQIFLSNNHLQPEAHQLQQQPYQKDSMIKAGNMEPTVKAAIDSHKEFLTNRSHYEKNSKHVTGQKEEISMFDQTRQIGLSTPIQHDNFKSDVSTVPREYLQVHNTNGMSNGEYNDHSLIINQAGNGDAEVPPIRLDVNHPLYRQYHNNSIQSLRGRYTNEVIEDDIPPPPPPNNSFISTHLHDATIHNHSFHNISAIPHGDSGSEHSNHDIHPRELNNSFANTRKPPLHNVKFGEGGVAVEGNHSKLSGDDYYRDMKSIFENTKKTIVSTENELNTLRNSNDVISLQIKCQQLEQLIDEKQHALETIQNNTSLLAQQYQEHMSALQEELQVVKRREEDITMKFQREIDDHLVRASNENNSFYDATIKSLKLQHDREMSLLQNELADERRKHQQVMEKEMHFRKRIEEDERHARAENNRLLDRINVLEFELQQLKDHQNQLSLASEREKRRQQLEYEQKIQDLQLQLDETQRDAEKSYQSKLADIRNKYESTIRNIKEKELELLKQEVEGDRIRCLLEYQKKCELDIESARTEERKLAAVEVEKVRQAFIQREKQTAKDLVELEKLHAKRVDQLEEAITAEQKKYQGLKEEYQQTSLAFERKLQDFVHQIQQLHDKNHESVMVNDALQREMKSMNERVEERALKEVHYREELSKALTELRLLQAEKLELSAQSSNSNAQSLQWRQILQDQEARYSAMDAQLKITKEENSMLEHEATRLKQENENLKSELEKCDRLIYGVPQHRVDHKKTVPIVIDPSSFSSSSTATAQNRSSNMGNLDPSNISFSSSVGGGAYSQRHIQQPFVSGQTSSQKNSNFMDFLNNTHGSLVSHGHMSNTSSTPKKIPNKSPSTVGNPKKTSPSSSNHIQDSRFKRSSSPTTFNPYHSQEMTISRAAKLPISQNHGIVQDQDILALMRKNKQMLLR